MLKRGSSGAGVEDLQRKLLANGINPGPVDGLFGPKTEDAVRRFQERHALQVDGIAGPKTMKALEDAAGDGPASPKSAASPGATAAGAKGAVAAGKQAASSQRKAAASKGKPAAAAQVKKAAASKKDEEKATTDKVGGVFSRIFKKD